MYNSLELLSILYPIAQNIYPTISSLIIVSGNEYDLIANGQLEIVDIRMTK